MIALILGLLIGSFLNVCIYRIPRHESIVFTSSHCTKCGNKIKWYDLVPVFSYIILRGRCRNCKEKISFVYPMVELANGLAYLGLYCYKGYTAYTAALCILVSVLITIIMIKIQNV